MKNMLKGKILLALLSGSILAAGHNTALHQTKAQIAEVKVGLETTKLESSLKPELVSNVDQNHSESNHNSELSNLAQQINAMTDSQMKAYVYGLFDSNEFPSLEVLRELSSSAKKQYVETFEYGYKKLSSQLDYHVGLEHAKAYLSDFIRDLSFEDLSTSKAFRQLAYKAVSPVSGMSICNPRQFSHKMKYTGNKDRLNNIALIKKAMNTFGLNGYISEYTKDDSYLLSQTDILTEIGLGLIASHVVSQQIAGLKNIKEITEITQQLLNFLGSHKLDMRFDLSAREYIASGLLSHIQPVSKIEIDVMLAQALGGPNLKVVNIKDFNAKAVKTHSDLLKFVKGNMPKDKLGYMNSLYGYVKLNRHAMKQKLLESKGLVSKTEDGIEVSAFIAKINEDLKSRYQEAADRKLLKGAQDFVKDWLVPVTDDNYDQSYASYVFAQNVVQIIKDGGLMTEEQIENMKKALNELDADSLIKKLGDDLLTLYTSDKTEEDKGKDFASFAYVHLQSISSFMAEQDYLLVSHTLAKNPKMGNVIEKVDTDNQADLLRWESSVSYVSNILDILTSLTPDWKAVKKNVKDGIFYGNYRWLNAKNQYEESKAESVRAEDNNTADETGHIDIQSAGQKKQN